MPPSPPARCRASTRFSWTSRACSAGRSSSRSHHERRQGFATVREQLRTPRRRVTLARSVDPPEDQDGGSTERSAARVPDIEAGVYLGGGGGMAAGSE